MGYKIPIDKHGNIPGYGPPLWRFDKGMKRWVDMPYDWRPGPLNFYGEIALESFERGRSAATYTVRMFPIANDHEFTNGTAVYMARDLVRDVAACARQALRQLIAEGTGTAFLRVRTDREGRLRLYGLWEIVKKGQNYRIQLKEA